MTTPQGGGDVTRRRVGLHVGNTVLRLAAIYKSAAEAVAQAVENGFDAEAKHVWVIMTPDRVSIIDDGHGMVRDIPAHDVRTIEEFEAGNFPTTTDVRKLLSPAALKSIERMMGRIGHSSKIPGENLDVEGTRGIGSLAVYLYAQTVQLRTRPRIDLAKEEGYADLKDIPVHILTPPTRQQLLDDDTHYSVTDSGDLRLVTNPFGKTLDHGTRVEVSDLLPGQVDHLHPGRLSAHFTFRFGNRIRRNSLELVIVDRFTKEGRKAPGGRQIYIQPIVYKGVALIDEDVELPSGGRFHVELYEKGRDFGSSIQVTRLGGGKFRLAELEHFNESPWNLVKGWVEFPFVPELDDIVWDSSKSNLLQSPQRTEWERVLHSLESRINAQLVEAKKRAQATSLRQLGEDLGEAAAAAIQAVPFFSDLLPGRKPKPTGPDDTTPRTPTVSTSVEARVVNEHNQPVADVVVRLSVRARLVAEAKTNKRGEVSFGKQLIGRAYMLAMDVPEDATCDGEDYDLFELTEDKPGYRFTFRLTTGQDAPPQQPPRKQLPPSIRFTFHPQDDGAPYQQRLPGGVININPSAPDFAEAQETQDEIRQTTLVAQYTAAAITDHANPGDIREGEVSMLLIQESLLFAKTFAFLYTRRGQRQQEARGREGRRGSTRG